MIFADKLIQLRKKSGWSQEELADQMNVTRQSVSKWEGAQTIPDLEKIIKLSELFGVSTDYLLKDEIEGFEITTDEIETPSLRRVSMEEANRFISAKTATKMRIALATLMCIISPICVIMLGALSEHPEYGISENAAGGIGMTVLLLLVAAAVALFISCRRFTADFDYLESESFECEYGVSGMIKSKRDSYRKEYIQRIMIGVSLCILSIVPLFVSLILFGENDMIGALMIAVLLTLVAIGVFIIIPPCIVMESYDKLLQEGDYAKKKKKEDQGLISALASAYWLTVTAIFVAVNLIGRAWDKTWVIWVVAALLYPALIAVIRLFKKEK